MRPTGYRTVNPYIEVEVFHSSDKRYKNDFDVDSQFEADPAMPLKHRTRIEPENGFNPAFDRTLRFKFATKYPELVFVRWSVKLSQDGTNYSDRAPVAMFTAKLTSLKQGYRTLPLLDNKGEQYLFSTLFCHIQLDPLATELYDYPADQGEPDNKRRGPISRNFFGRSTTSPKSSMEKLSRDSSFS
jgi:phosphatidylinositol phospholipase C delta